VRRRRRWREESSREGVVETEEMIDGGRAGGRVDGTDFEKVDAGTQGDVDML